MDFRMRRTQETIERELLVKPSGVASEESDSDTLYDSRRVQSDSDLDFSPETHQNSRFKWLPTNLNLFKGLFYAFMSGVLLSLTSVTVKMLGDVHPGELAAYRFLAIMVFTLPMLIQARQPLYDLAYFQLFLFRAVFESFSIVFRYYAVQALPLADANVIIFSSPVFVAILARIFLKEKCSPVIVGTLFMTMLGLLLVVKVPLILMNGGIGEFADKERLTGVAYGFASVLFNAGCFILIRKIKDVHHTLILFSLGWMASIGSGIITMGVDGFTLPRDCDYRAGVWVLLGVFSITGQIFLTKGLQLEQAGPISIVRTGSDIVLAFVWQLIFFGETADGYTISGAALVTSGGIILNVRKWLMAQPEDHPTRRRFWYLAI